MEESEFDIEIVPASALEAIERAGVDVAIATAKKYPRDVTLCLKTCRELALRNKEIAARLHYAKPKAGKRISGKSVHFARIIAYSWQNITAVSRIIGADRDHVTAQAVAHDLERNTRIGVEIHQPVQAPKNLEGSNGEIDARWRTQVDDTKRAATAIAYRNSIFQVVPEVLFDDIAEAAKRLGAGIGSSFVDSRNTILNAFKEKGVTNEQVFRVLNVNGADSIGTDDLIYIQGLWTAIKEGSASLEELFGSPLDAVKAKVPRTAQVRFGASAKAQPEAKTEVGSQPPTPPAAASDPVAEETARPAKKAEKRKSEAPKEVQSGGSVKVLRELAAKDSIPEETILEFIQVAGYSREAKTLDEVSETDLQKVLRDWGDIKSALL